MSLAQGNNTPTRPRIEPGSPDPESNALTIRPVRPPWQFVMSHYRYYNFLKEFSREICLNLSKYDFVSKSLNLIGYSAEEIRCVFDDNSKTIFVKSS